MKFSMFGKNLIADFTQILGFIIMVISAIAAATLRLYATTTLERLFFGALVCVLGALGYYTAIALSRRMRQPSPGVRED
jgi:hypothetical protein